MKIKLAHVWIINIQRLIGISIILLLIFCALPVRTVSAATGISITDVVVTEPANSSTVQADFVVTCTPDTGGTTLSYSTSDGSAKSGSDYEAVSGGTLTITDCSNPDHILVTVKGDNLVEHDEIFSITISSTDPLDEITRSTAIATIHDTQTSVLSISRGSDASEPATDGHFIFSLNNPLSYPLNVTYSVGGTAIASTNYEPLSGSLTIPAEEITYDLPVQVLDDLQAGPDKTVLLTLTGTNSLQVNLNGSPSATLTIKEGDSANISINDPTITEGDSGSSFMAFTVSLSISSTLPISMNYATNDGTAKVNFDYQSTIGTLNFAAGDTSETILVPIIGDLINEPTESFTLLLSGAINATIVKEAGTGTIIDNDPIPVISITNASVNEGDTGTSYMQFNVTLSNSSVLPISVLYTTQEGTAKAGADYQTVSGTLNFAAGEFTKTILVPIVGDLVYEPTETFTVLLSGATNATLAQTTGAGTIYDNDSVPSMSIADAILTEGDSGTINMSFMVTLSNPSDFPISVLYTTQTGTANVGFDYLGISGTLNFAAGEITKTIEVPIVGDQVNEITETFTVLLSGATNANIFQATGTGTILDNDPLPGLSIDDVTVGEGLSGTSPMNFTVTLTGATEQTVTVAYTTVDGTAKSPSSYIATSGVLTFSPGTTTQTITVLIVGDMVAEPTKYFTVQLSNSTNATIIKPNGTCTILDLDPPALSIDDAALTEGNALSSPMTFTVTLIGLTEFTVTVDYTTISNTALPASDYVVTTGTLTFLPGTTTQTIIVPIVGDLVNEPTETFWVRLSNPSNSMIVKADGTGTILDNDPLPTLSINNTSLIEGNSLTTPMTFNVALAGATAQTVTVAYATVPNTAIAGSDYVATTGTLTFAPGITTQTIIVPIVGDLVNEPTETFLVRLSGATNATIIKSDGTGTISDNDPLPTLSINDSTLTEGDSGTTPMTFTVTLTGPTVQTVIVGYTTVLNTAAAPADYVATSGTLTFSAGTTTQTIVVPIVGDLVDEPTETFWVRLNNPTNAALLRTDGIGTISDNDPLPILAFSQNTPYTVLEDDPSGQALIQVNLSSASDYLVTVNYATSDGTARQGINYQATSGTLTFPSGTTSQTIKVPILNDHQNNPTLTLTIILTTPANATLGNPSSASLAIFDQDAQPMLSIDNVSINEGDIGTKGVTFSVTLSSTSGNVVTVDYDTYDGTAIAGSDYISTSGQLIFNPGVVKKTITVVVKGDNDYEPDENFTVRLSNAQNALIFTDTSYGTILNDDPYRIVLPIISSGSGKPDLTIASFTLTPSKTSFHSGEPVLITVQLKNIGNADAGPFWVDLYINPQRPPDKANIPWNTDCGMTECYGIAWNVKNGLKAGKTITLTSTASSYVSEYTNWLGSLPTGTSDLYVYVDSWGGYVNPDGAVIESSEANNLGEIHGLQVTASTINLPKAPEVVAALERKLPVYIDADFQQWIFPGESFYSIRSIFKFDNWIRYFFQMDSLHEP